MTHKGLVGWRYDARSNYMITLVTEPRRGLFGTLREWGVERSAAGKAVYDAWQAIERRFPEVRATYNMIMPDHFHGIVYVMVEGVVDLNEVVQFFAEAVERRLGRTVWCALYRDSICLAKGQLHRQINYILSNARRRWVKEQNPDLFRKLLGFRHWRLRRASMACAAVGQADDWNFWSFARGPGDECWSLATGDEIVKPRKANRVVSPFGDGAGQQAYDSKGNRQQAYDSKGSGRQVYDSKVGRETCDGTTCCRTLAVSAPAAKSAVDWVVLGNPFLLDAPLLVSTRISTAVSPADLETALDQICQKASRGAVLVSPFVSPGEKAARAAALEAGGSVVQLLAEGMGRYYKPSGRDFDLCAEGRLLQLSPFQPPAAGVSEREKYGKPRFEWLNLAARNISDMAIDRARPRRLAGVVAACFALALPFVAAASECKSFRVTCEKYEPGVTFDVGCWAADGLANGKGAVYVLLEWDAAAVRKALEPLMKEGAIPPGLVVSFCAGSLRSEDNSRSRGMRACEFDQPGTEFPSAIAEEIVPAAEKALGVTASCSPDLHFIAGASSGGIAAWNACWYRNDYFRRAYCNSPTFSNMRGGCQLMQLARKCETRPIRAYLTCGTDEPDYFFGDSYFVAEDAIGALRFAGYDVMFDRFVHEGHGAMWGDDAYLAKVMAWLFQDWRTKPVSVSFNPIRVRDVLSPGSMWRECNFKMPPPVRSARSSDGWRLYSVSPTNRFVVSERLRKDGSHDQRVRLAPLELAWNATRVGGTALAVGADDRIWVATELGVQGVVSFGINDLVLPLPDDLPCDNVALVGTNLYAASGERVFCRSIRVGEADPSRCMNPATPGYGDGFKYSREHEPAGGVGELLGGYVMAGRIAGVVSVLSDARYFETYDCAGWSKCGDWGRGVLMRKDDLFAVFSMTKTFTGIALMCAIDEGKISLDDEVAKYLPEFADVKMRGGSKPKRPLTIRDLTSHVTGFRASVSVINRDKPLREVARWLAAQPLEFQPGETFAYGNAWFDAAAACLEVAVGEPYEKYLQRKVLGPLGMKDTTFWPSAEQLKRLVTAYNSDDTTIRPAKDDCARQLVFPKEGKIFPAASGGLFSTPVDMVRFSQMLAHHGEWKGTRIVSRKTFDGVFAVKQTPPSVKEPYACGAWIYGDWIGHEGAMRTDQRANIRTGQSRVFFIQTENRAGKAFFHLKNAWHEECDRIQKTSRTVFGH